MLKMIQRIRSDWILLSWIGVQYNQLVRKGFLIVFVTLTLNT